MTEIYALNDSIDDGLWLKNTLEELQPLADTSSLVGPNEPITIYEDNQAAIKMCKEPGNHQRTKAWGKNLFRMRDEIKDRNFDLEWIPGTENTADVFTKSLPLVLFEKHVNGLGLRKQSTDGK